MQHSLGLAEPEAERTDRRVAITVSGNEAAMYGEQIRERVVPLVRKDIEVFERWIAEGRIAPVNATHLLFAI